MCSRTDGVDVGNPIIPGAGDKVEQATDYADNGAHPLSFVRVYRSIWGARTDWGVGLPRAPSTMGLVWNHNYGTSLVATDDPVREIQVMQVIQGDGYARSFIPVAGTTMWQASQNNDSLSQTANGWIYRRTDDDSISQFDASGKLLSVTQRNGWTMTYSYTADVLTQVRNQFGRTLTFGYNAARTLISVTTAGGEVIRYQYDSADRLVSVQRADGVSKSYAYENPVFSLGLTGVIDETGTRFATFSYENGSYGRATSTEHAGGVDRYSVNYNYLTSIADSVVEVIDPLGTRHFYYYKVTDNKMAVVGASMPAAGGRPSIANRALDANGLVIAETDFAGTRTTYSWDTVRRLALTKTRAAGGPQALATSTQWHPTMALQAVVAEPGRRTTYVYNGQPDPFNAGTLAQCAPAAALLPDGNPVAVLCKQVQQATSDADGSVGLTAPLQSGVAARIWTWSYDLYSQVLIASDPLNHGSTRTYYSDTTDSHRAGDLRSVTNAMGHTTQYGPYGGNGNLLTTTDPNGVSTVYAYDARNRLTSVSLGTQTTSYSYTTTGLLSQTTQADASTITYSYDAAQRLNGASDSLGNSISYTLDNAGNRTAEQIKDPAGALKRQVNRAFDALGNLQQTTGLN